MLKVILRYVNIAALIVVGLLAIAYAVDFALVRIPIPMDKVVYSTVTVRPDSRALATRSRAYFEIG